VEIVAKYGYGSELEMNGAQGFLAFVPDGTVQAINLSSLIFDCSWMVLCCVFVHLLSDLVDLALASLAFPLVGIGRIGSLSFLPH